MVRIEELYWRRPIDRYLGSFCPGTSQWIVEKSRLEECCNFVVNLDRASLTLCERKAASFVQIHSGYCVCLTIAESSVLTCCTYLANVGDEKELTSHPCKSRFRSAEPEKRYGV